MQRGDFGAQGLRRHVLTVLGCLAEASASTLAPRRTPYRWDRSALSGRDSARIEDVNGCMDRMETRLDRIDGRLRGVEVAFGKVDQRLASLELILLPAPSD